MSRLCRNHKAAAATKENHGNGQLDQPMANETGGNKKLTSKDHPDNPSAPSTSKECQVDEEGNKPLNQRAVLRALDAGADIDAVETSDNYTPVNIAASEGHWDIVLELNKRGANITIPSLKYKDTVVHWVSKKGAKQVVLKALIAGADINAVKTYDNSTPINATASEGHWDIVLELCSVMNIARCFSCSQFEGVNVLVLPPREGSIN